MKQFSFILLTTIAILMLMLPSIKMEAQWGGSTTNTGKINRWGHVGIGVADPQVRLDISNDNSPAIRISDQTLGSSIFLTAISTDGFYSNEAKAGDVALITGGSATGNLIIGSRSSDNILFTTGNWSTEETRMSIGADGKIKIGSNLGTLETPGNYKLYVKDGILTEKIKVALHDDPNNWADYVFDNDYELMPLQQFRKFITTHKHLPNIPSSQELIDGGGVELMEMTRLQMEKIEELSLYILQLDERMKKLEEENEELRNQLDAK